MDRFDEMRARGSNSGGGGGGESDGFLPLPASQLEFTQTLSNRGKGKVHFVFPRDADEVQLLIKKDGLPQNLNDYDEIHSFENGGIKEIEFNSNEKGSYANEYGLWAVSKNEAGRQSALNNTNRYLYRIWHSQGISKEVDIPENVPLLADLSTYRFENYIFVSEYSKSSGLIMIDMEVNTADVLLEFPSNQGSSNGRRWERFVRLDENTVLGSPIDGNYGAGVINLTKKTIEKAWETTPFTDYIETDKYIFFWATGSSNRISNGSKTIYSKGSKEFITPKFKEYDDLNGSNAYDYYNTTQGVFAIRKGSTTITNQPRNI